jgi:hypothetical protein
MLWMTVPGGGAAAQAAADRGDPAAAYVTANIARYIARRTLLVGFEAPWIEDWRSRLATVNITALETFAQACLAIGGPELAAADRLVLRAERRTCG